MVEKYDYSEDREAADELIAEFGQSGYLRAPGVSTPAPGGDTEPWDPGTGDTVATPVDTPITFVVVDFSESEKDGTLIQQSDQKALIAAGGTATINPNGSYELLNSDKSETWTVVRLSPTAPGGVVVLYQAQVRK